MRALRTTIGLLLAAVSAAAPAQNLLTDPDFTGPEAGWRSFGNVSFDEFFGSVFGPHASFFADDPLKSGGIFDLNVNGVAGTKYEFFLNAVNIESNFDGTMTLGLEFYESDNSTQISSVDLLLDLTTAKGGGLGYDLRGQAVSGTAPLGTVFVRPIVTFTGGVNDEGYDNAFISAATVQAIPNPIKSIVVNQVGYFPESKKVAFTTSGDSNTFTIFTKAGEAVFSGVLELINGGTVDKNSGDILKQADFSAVTEEGYYYLKIEDTKSATFAIKKDVYHPLLKSTMKFFHHQRCGGNGIDVAYVGEEFAHAGCHLNEARYYDPADEKYSQTVRDVSGGWHDAGDYNRYSTPAAKAVADLLLAIEHFPKIKDLAYGGPYNILEEVRYKIEWMLKMQDTDSGAVFHKVSNERFPGNVPPEKDTAPNYLSPISAQATGGFAAVMANASRLHKETDAAFAEKCLEAAIQAWNWLEKNPNIHKYVDPEFFQTGSYEDEDSSDERHWAAAELYRTTADEKYHHYMQQKEVPPPGFGWQSMGSYAALTYLTTPHAPIDEKLHKETRERFITIADHLLLVAKEDGYGVLLDKYEWGSNKDLCDGVMVLINAYRLTGEAKYQKPIEDQLHYLLGRNTNDISYVTGFGERSAKNPHHRPSRVAGRALEGMLVGGPYGDIMNDPSAKWDPLSKIIPEGTPQAKCYKDIGESYATNEVTIYWNSPLVYMLSFIAINEPQAP